ncbi:MAG: hypothetical protein ACJAUD_002062 [Crocinitomicaceae bacterium]|jgi:hypothetical protein
MEAIDGCTMRLKFFIHGGQSVVNECKSAIVSGKLFYNFDVKNEDQHYLFVRLKRLC